MVLTLEQMLGLCEKPKNKALIDSCKELHKEHKRHITGEGYKMLITFHEGYETDRQRKVKDTMSQPATLPITKIILDELNRWTNSQGTYKAYDFNNKKEIEDRFIQKTLGQVWRNRSMDNFIMNEYKESLDMEFCSFLTVVKPKVFTYEKKNFQDREGIVSTLAGSYARPYIIFTSINDVIDFMVYGNKVEYIIMKFKEEVDENGKKSEYFRAIDDEKDVVIVKDDKNRYEVAVRSTHKRIPSVGLHGPLTLFCH